MKFMSNQEIDVTMISSDGPEVKQVVSREGCPHIIIPLTRKITPLADLKALWLMYRTLKSIKPDIVHTHTPKAGLIGMMACYIARIPVRLHTVAGLPLHTTKGLKFKLLTFIEKLTYACATQVLPNSISLYNYIIKHKLTNIEKLDIIGVGSSNGIDLKDFNRNNLQENILEKVKRSISYNPHFTYLLFVGRVVKDKGIVELVEAFKLLGKSIINLRLILVGPFEKDLDPLPLITLKEIESNESIISIGYSNNVKYYMHLANLFVFPSHREGFPNVLLQAGAMECTIVCSDIGGNKDIVGEGDVRGVTFVKGNVEDLIKKIQGRLANKESSIKMSQNLFNWIHNNLEREKIHKLLLAKYRDSFK